MMNEETLLNWFMYHAPVEGQMEKYAAIRAAGLEFARIIVDNTPTSADQAMQ